MAAVAACYAGDLAEGARLVDPIKAAVGEPLLDALGPLPYIDQQTRVRSCFLDDLTDPVIDVLVDRAGDIQAPPALELIVEHMGGAIAAGDGAYVPASFGDRLARLGAVKAQYDPHKVFSLNQNVTPAP